MHDFINYIFRLLQRGIFFVIPVLLISIVLLVAIWLIARKKNHPIPWKKVLVSFMLLGWAGLTVFATMLRGESGFRQWNFHLFLAWREAWNQFTLQVWLNVLLNIALFVPLGILLPLLARVFRKWYCMLFTGFGTSLAIELCQFILERGIMDVDDLFTNTLGSMIGWSIVMLILTMMERGIRQKKLCLAYLSIPTAFTFALAVIFISYNAKPYGNLPDATTITANLDAVQWKLDFTPEESPSTAIVYQAGRLKQSTAEQFGEEFAEKTGIVFEDTYYYDDTIIFANHFTGDFLNLNQRDGTWEYKIGQEKMPVFQNSPSDIRSEDILEALLDLGIWIPEEAQFIIELSEGNEFFKASYQADFTPVGDTMLYGTINCRLHIENGKTKLDEIQYNMATLSPCQEESILTPAQAVEKLYGGRSFEGILLERLAVKEVKILSCHLDWMADTKGFYQPVYCFEIQIGEQETMIDYVSALK
jgi:glycopeptide antibiotics resistance protein